jgi:S2P endopeptidase
MITAINGQPVRTKDNFRESILAALQEHDHGYCVHNSTLYTLKTAPEGPTRPDDCCPAGAGGEHLCFAGPAASYLCLPARSLISSANTTCTLSHTADEVFTPCPQPDHLCVVPFFGPATNDSGSTKLVRVERAGGEKDFLFVGNPAVIYTTVRLSEFCPRYAPVPGWLPDLLLKMAHYIASFSGALAVLNVVPCYMLDGQHMMDVLMEMVMAGSCSIRRRRLQTTITLLGTGQC